jgi:hypothetical protein
VVILLQLCCQVFDGLSSYLRPNSMPELVSFVPEASTSTGRNKLSPLALNTQPAFNQGCRPDRRLVGEPF